MKFKVSTKDIKNDEGIVYLLEMHIEGKVLVKIGITQREKIEERVVEILTSAFKKYREFFYCRPKRFKKTDRIFEKEARLHRYFEEARYKTEHSFGGCTEIFDIPLDEAVEVYEKLLKEEELGSR